MSTIERNIQIVYKNIIKAALDYKRDPHQITLLAVSKTKSIKDIQDAILAGQRHFGENYVKEGIKKIIFFRNQDEGKNIIWHFLGLLQTNKSLLVSQHFDWCHSLASSNLARRLNNHRPAYRLPLNVLIQINLDKEPTKSGIAPKKMLSLAETIAEYPRLRLRGLMTIPTIESDFQKQLTVFKRMYDLYQTLQRLHRDIDTLSMGMTRDMSAAIAAGSTLVRIGTGIFGARE